jgi:hypothetical protein
MSNAFNPFAQPAQAPAPVAQLAPAQPQRPIPTGLNDANSDGFSTQMFKHVEGEFDLKITGYVGARTPILKSACHITFEVVTSTTPEIPVGSTWRIAYKYNYEQSRIADADTYGKDCECLAGFVQALYRQSTKTGFDAAAGEKALHAHDWSTQPGFVHLSASLGKAKPSKDDPKTLRRYRNDRWSSPKQ